MTDPAQKEMHENIDAIRTRLGRKLLILGHHYQRPEIVRHADMLGDSFQLSAAAAENLDCETIVFCGVHFMAETADILANSPENRQKRDGRRVAVVLPDPKAGCSMADMATAEDVQKCWDQLSTTIDVDDLVPITYVNSTATLKAFCGRHGGISCTSTNARSVLDWAFSRKQRVLFFPDQHLGRNTALAMGIPETAMSLWDPSQPMLGGQTPEAIRESRILLWKGYCDVHQKFRPEHIDAVRNRHAGIRVIVHPECCREVVDKADEFGSTAYILKRVTESPSGSVWAVGTESRFVERLAADNPDKTVINLSEEPSYCETMAMIELPKLENALRNIEAGEPKNVIRVPDAIAAEALACLRRMLECS